MNVLLFILFFSIWGVFICSKLNLSHQIIKTLFFFISGIILILSSFILTSFDTNLYYFQYVTFYSFNYGIFNISCSFGLDGISLFFFLLSSFLVFFCILFIWEERFLKEYLLLFLVLHLLLLLVFSTLDLFFFYICFEIILIPMYLMIGVLGSRERKIRAAYLFFFYTLFGSLLMLIALVYIYSTVGSLNLEYLLKWNFTTQEQYWLWLAFFFSFAAKIPIFPFHIWLPEAHVEASTPGSVLLAGILLKLGVYGFLRFSIPLFPAASLYFSPIVFFLSIIGIVYTSFNALRQTDFKRIIAYSSIAHMNLIVLGIFSFNNLGLEGAILQSTSHGFVSGALFYLIGIIYDRYHSRLLYYYGGLVHVMPVYSIFFLLFSMANIALPGTSSFIGEFLLLCGVYQKSIITAVISCTSVVLSGAYSLWLCNRLIFGNLKFVYTLKFVDLDAKEFCVLLPLLILVIFIGLYPPFLSTPIHLAVATLSFID